MKRIFPLSGLALILVLAGCVVMSVYPYYTEKDLTFDAALVGTWTDKEAGPNITERWVFEKAGEKGYTFAMLKDSETNTFSAHLFKLQEHLLLDFMPSDLRDQSIPPHYLMSVTQTQPTLKMQMMSYEWLAKYLEKNPKAIRHIEEREPGETNKGPYILTADTKDLQKFVLKHLKTEGAFEKIIELERLETKSKP
jgi:hypothetical protein